MTLIQAQERLIARVNGSHPGHQRRVSVSASRELRRYLSSIGVQDKQQQDAVIKDARDMAALERNCDE